MHDKNQNQMTDGLAIDGLKIDLAGASDYLVTDQSEKFATRYQVDDAGNICVMQHIDGTQPNQTKSLTTVGLTDIQVNGFAGIDFNSEDITSSRMDQALAHMATCGVTRVLPTLITAEEDVLVARLAQLDKAVSKSVLGPLMVSGYHIEGPFLSPKDGCSGAHPAAAMRAGSKLLVQRLMEVASRPLLVLTVAPEQDGVLKLIPFLLKQGITCAIGHSMASRSEIAAAIKAGATLSTHLGNGLPHVLNKNENPLLSQLGRDELTASFIADGIHVHPENLQSYIRAKTLDRTIIVTDAVSAAGPDLTPGKYSMGGTKIELHEDGSVRIPGSIYLAGSSATMDQMVRNLMKWYNYSMGDILRMTRKNPARTVAGFAPALKVSSSAEFVNWATVNGEMHVCETRIGPWRIRRKSD